MYVPDKFLAQRAVKEAKLAEKKSKKGYYLDSAKYIRQAINDEKSIRNQNYDTQQATQQMQNMEGRYLNPTYQTNYLNLGSKESTRLSKKALKSVNYLPYVSFQSQPNYQQQVHPYVFTQVPPQIPPQIPSQLPPASSPPNSSGAGNNSASAFIEEPSRRILPFRPVTPSIVGPSLIEEPIRFSPIRNEAPHIVRPSAPVQPSLVGSIFRLVFGGTPEEKYATQKESFRTLLNDIMNEKRQIIELLDVLRDPTADNRRGELAVFIDNSNNIFFEQFPDLYNSSTEIIRQELIANYRQILQHEQDLRRRLTEQAHLQTASPTILLPPTVSTPDSPALQVSQLRRAEQASRDEEEQRNQEQRNQRAAQSFQTNQAIAAAAAQAAIAQAAAAQAAANQARADARAARPTLVNLRPRGQNRHYAQLDLRLQLQALSRGELERIALGQGQSFVNGVPVKYLGYTQSQLDAFTNRRGDFQKALLIERIVTASRNASLILMGGLIGGENPELRKRRWYFKINGVEGSQKFLDPNHAATIVQQFKFQYPYAQVRLGAPGRFNVLFSDEVLKPKPITYSSNNHHVNLNDFY